MEGDAILSFGMRLILASASPRRAELLTAAGFTFELCAADVDERVRPGEAPREYVARLASEKAARAYEKVVGPAEAGHYGQGVGPAEAGHRVQGVVHTEGVAHPEGAVHKEGVVPGFSRAVRSDRRTGDPRPDVLIIAADTAVIVDGRILGKPVDQADATRMIRQLSGRAHVVLTGVGARGPAFDRVVVEETRVEFARLTDEQVAWYVATGEGMDKAGGYAIQGLASRFIPRIEGSYTNVVGLPVTAVDELIRAAERGMPAVASGR
jgi:MAF protein